MPSITATKVATGTYWVEAPDVGLRILCGCPADSVKHLMRRGHIVPREESGVSFETGPNAILLSDVPVQNGRFANLAEFPVMQMLYRQGMALPDHPNNTGAKPLLIGAARQVRAQMRYVHRGNYGLVSEEEMREAGMPAGLAHEMMRLKLMLAFGEIRPTEELVDSIIVGRRPVEIRGGVILRRLHLNVFEFQCGEDTVTVDLNLGPHESYEAPYTLGYHRIDREYFAVVHSGDGDGWDPNRPAMSSILLFQGAVYLIDAGLNLLHGLDALGIGVSEIEGIFHTHGHDEHFSGLTTLMRSDHKIKYFATPWVRASVMKKLSELLSMDEDEFSHFFDVHDLEADTWNHIGGLEVRPALSPHPVETAILLFRATSEDGYRSYAHFGDIISLDMLSGMVEGGPDGPGISPELFSKVKSDYLTQADIKKIDAGGDLIHGKAEDFRDDPSGRIVLSHTSRELTDKEKEIGSGAPFGSVDVLIPLHHDFVRQSAGNYLQSYFPTVPEHELVALLNQPVVDFNPETIIIRTGEHNQYLYLILTGYVEMIRAELGLHSRMSAGGFVGEHSGLAGTPSEETYRAASFVQALRLPANMCLELARRNRLYPIIERARKKREFLQRTWLFGDAISYPIQIRIAESMQLRHVHAGQELEPGAEAGIFLVRGGELELLVDKDVIETLSAGDFCGESTLLYGTPGLFRARAVAAAEVYYVPGDVLADIPVVRWKLLEAHERRTRMLLDPELLTVSVFQWRDEYRTNVNLLDSQHMQLLKLTDELHRAILAREDRSALDEALARLAEYTALHFSDEEQLMKQQSFPGYRYHQRRHEAHKEEIADYQGRFRAGDIELDADFVAVLQDWVVEHLLSEDQTYARFVHETQPSA